MQKNKVKQILNVFFVAKSLFPKVYVFEVFRDNRAPTGYKELDLEYADESLSQNFLAEFVENVPRFFYALCFILVYIIMNFISR